jgi:shikimate dehydrogenase
MVPAKMKDAASNPGSPSRRILTGLLGAPIAQSAAPDMHERAADALGLRCHYQLIEVAGAGREELKLLLEGVRRLGFAGINVTFPYKEAVLDLLDELSPVAARIGAVNTVIVRNNKLIGHNTDTTGFARAVAPLVTASSQGPVAVIGAGGVGKAIGFALAGLGVTDLRIFDSEPAKATQLSAKLDGAVKATVSAASRTRCVARSVWSTPRRWECCPAPAHRFRITCSTPGCGLPMRFIHRSGRHS